jgi:uncharacterized lipoprotein YajG
MKKLLTCGLLLLASCATPSTLHVVADRATHDAIAPDHRSYVLADPTLTQEQRDRRLLVLETWRIRLEAAEKAVK